MNREQSLAIGKALCALCEAHGIDYEELLQHQAELARIDAEKQNNVVVKSCLEDMAKNLDSASESFYVSLRKLLIPEIDTHD